MPALVGTSEKCERSQQTYRGRTRQHRGERGDGLGDWGRVEGMARWVEAVVNFSTGEGFWCGHQLRVLAIVKLGKWILYVVHIRQSLHPVIT